MSVVTCIPGRAIASMATRSMLLIPWGFCWWQQRAVVVAAALAAATAAADEWAGTCGFVGAASSVINISVPACRVCRRRASNNTHWMDEPPVTELAVERREFGCMQYSRQDQKCGQMGWTGRFAGN